MEETSRHPRHLSSADNHCPGDRRPVDKYEAEEVKEDDGEEEELEPEAWSILSKGFEEVQSLQEQNRVLIRQVNQNQESKLHENLVKNVALIREINDNMSRIKSIYSHLSVDFSAIFRQQQQQQQQ